MSASVITAVMNDRDHAVQVAEQLFYPRVSLDPTPGPTPFRAELQAARLTPAVAAGIAVYSVDTCGVVTGDTDAYKVALPLAAGLDVGIGRNRHAATPDTGVVVGPFEETTFSAFGGAPVLIMKFAQSDFESHLARLLGRDPEALTISTPEFDVRSGRGARWRGLADVMVTMLREPDDAAWNPLMNAQLASLTMSTLLMATDHSLRESLDRPAGSPATPAVIRKAVDIIHARADEPLTIPDLAGMVGASPRTVHRGFVEHLGTNPSTYLSQVRLDRAHDDLVAGTPLTTSVSTIAARWGFSNAGRFAAQYQGRFGVVPSVTLARG